jgi:F0F1-type ATP synthase gamma subunit
MLPSENSTSITAPIICIIFPLLVPMVAGEVTGMDYHWDYIYEPDAQEALGALLVRYIEALVYQGLVENIAFRATHCNSTNHIIT